ncbi:uncharacterized protein BCR38DRAFT_474742 [Pseudomassariella vexata]|uniref:Uncharacterized protein n=1 Tax=Pseudomassariella vexata TaxID=1141098 RepID=A0A1Y2DYE6_9PEZI|nr:uncharacterized protein BCR38DRAFT_474742 [Pseudomassariella vexata]ORY64229.1 hypothetical protein BCR38DRAFT_474742 [Pseudomassariella vexata]
MPKNCEEKSDAEKREERQARKINRWGYRGIATEEDKERALDLALSRIPRKRKTFLDNAELMAKLKADAKAQGAAEAFISSPSAVPPSFKKAQKSRGPSQKKSRATSAPVSSSLSLDDLTDSEAAGSPESTTMSEPNLETIDEHRLEVELLAAPGEEVVKPQAQQGPEHRSKTSTAVLDPEESDKAVFEAASECDPDEADDLHVGFKTSSTVTMIESEAAIEAQTKKRIFVDLDAELNDDELDAEFDAIQDDETQSLAGSSAADSDVDELEAQLERARCCGP